MAWVESGKESEKGEKSWEKVRKRSKLGKKVVKLVPQAKKGAHFMQKKAAKRALFQNGAILMSLSLLLF